MTTLFIWHQWIEASETGDTVLSAFGQWWDGDAGGGGETPLAVFESPMFTGGLQVLGVY